MVRSALRVLSILTVLTLTTLAVIAARQHWAGSSVAEPALRVNGGGAGLSASGAVAKYTSPSSADLLRQQLAAAAATRQASEAQARAVAAARKRAEQARRKALAEARREQAEQALARAARAAARDPRSVARLLVSERGWSSSQFSCLDSLWQRESRWNYRATNPSSGAYGIPQALPGRKMATVGSDWRTNPVTQITWGLKYIASIYGTPCGAWAHSESHGWY